MGYAIYSDTEKMMHLYSILALYQHPQLFSLELSASKLMFYFKFMHAKLIVEYQKLFEIFENSGTWSCISWVVYMYTCMFWGSFDVVDILNSKLLLLIVHINWWIVSS